MENNVECLICHRKFKALWSNGHLVTHNITLKQYKEMFPEAKTISELTHFNRSITNKGENNPMFGVKRTGKCYWTRERNLKQVGVNNPWKGKHHTKETKLKQMKTKIKNKKYNSFNPTEKYYEDLGMKFKSTWEANIARIYNFLGVKWIYEPKIFKLETCYYCPDFYLPEYGFFVEVKGFMREKSKIKIDEFSKKYPLEVIDSNDYKEWCECFPEITNTNKFKEVSK